MVPLNTPPGSVMAGLAAVGTSSARYGPVMLVPSLFFATGTVTVRRAAVLLGTSPCQAEYSTT
ncbi:hypothetical protein D3C72_2463460 [compost metagenome]